MQPKPAIMTYGRGSGIVFRRDKLHVLILESKIVQGFLDEVRVFIANVAKLSGGHSDEQNTSCGMAIACWLQPCVVGMSIDLFFQRVENAQPRIRRKTGSGNRHSEFFRWATGAGSAPGYKNRFVKNCDQPVALYS